MVAKVRLHDVITELEAQGDATVYLLKNTGEFVPVSEDLESASHRDIEDVPEWERELLPKVKEALESEHSVPLPSQFDVHEWDIMRQFSESRSDPDVSVRLGHAIHGPGAFRFFKAELRHMGLEKEWYSFREEAFERIAIAWLEENETPYEH